MLHRSGRQLACASALVGRACIEAHCFIAAGFPTCGSFRASKPHAGSLTATTRDAASSLARSSFLRRSASWERQMPCQGTTLQSGPANGTVFKRGPSRSTARYQEATTDAMPEGHMASRTNLPVGKPVVFKHEFGGCGNRVQRLGGRARSIFHFTQQLVGTSTRCSSARFSRGSSQVRAMSSPVASFRRAGRHPFARFTVCGRCS
jgi:hypothetical protein